MGVGKKEVIVIIAGVSSNNIILPCIQILGKLAHMDFTFVSVDPYGLGNYWVFFIIFLIYLCFPKKKVPAKLRPK